jgi:hypothetical protein
MAELLPVDVEVRALVVDALAAELGEGGEDWREAVAGRVAERLRARLVVDQQTVERVVRRCTEQLAAAMGVDVLGRTYESLLGDVALNLRDTSLLLRTSQALGEVAQEVGLPLPEEKPSRVAQAVRETIAGLRRELERLGRETTMAQLAAGLLVATDPLSTGELRGRVRRELLAWASPGGAASKAVRDALLVSSVDALDLSVRASNLLLGMEVRTIGELVRRTEQELRAQGASTKVLREYSEELAKLGLFLAAAPAALAKSATSPRSRGRVTPSGGR